MSDTMTGEASIDRDLPDEVMGMWRVEAAEKVAEEFLWPLAFGTEDFPDRIESYEFVYRIGDDAYVTEKDWDDVWDQFPDWMIQSYLVADNNDYYSSRDVAAMTISQLLDLDPADLGLDYVYGTYFFQEEIDEIAASRAEKAPAPGDKTPLSEQREKAERATEADGHAVAVLPRGGTSR